AVHFGIHRKTLSPFAGCRAPLGARAYRWAVLLPGIALGFAPAVVGLAAGAGWVTIWGAFMVLTAGGDFAALWAMRSVRGHERVLDHPERVGCRVVA
ncbi:MAG TPA: metalloprotease family protein, partial [Longimicrobium sp.]|nr:metalloprotease family protein [Longimicrobium sp.]